jgi:hypothetical protein
MTPTAECDRISEAVQHARLFEPSTARGRERLDAALLHIDRAIARAGDRENIPVSLDTTDVAIVVGPLTAGTEDDFVLAVERIAAATSNAVSVAAA